MSVTHHNNYLQNHNLHVFVILDTSTGKKRHTLEMCVNIKILYLLYIVYGNNINQMIFTFLFGQSSLTVSLDRHDRPLTPWFLNEQKIMQIGT